MKKSFILALVAVLFACTARADDVTSDMAMVAANAWAARNAAFGAGASAQSVLTVSDTNAAHTVLWHQVSMTGGGCVVVYNNVRPSLASVRVPSDDPGLADELRDAELYLGSNAAALANSSFSVRLLGFGNGGSMDLAGGTVTAGGVFARGNRNDVLDEPGTHRESDDARLDPVLFNGGRIVVTPYFPPAN